MRVDIKKVRLSARQIKSIAGTCRVGTVHSACVLSKNHSSNLQPDSETSSSRTPAVPSLTHVSRRWALVSLSCIAGEGQHCSFLPEGGCDASEGQVQASR